MYHPLPVCAQRPTAESYKLMELCERGSLYQSIRGGAFWGTKDGVRRRNWVSGGSPRPLVLRGRVAFKNICRVLGVLRHGARPQSLSSALRDDRGLCSTVLPSLNGVCVRRWGVGVVERLARSCFDKLIILSLQQAAAQWPACFALAVTDR
jgi:hypothetical protein